MWKLIAMKPSSYIKIISGSVVFNMQNLRAWVCLSLHNQFFPFFFLAQRFKSSWPIKSFLKCTTLSSKSLPLYILYYGFMEHWISPLSTRYCPNSSWYYILGSVFDTCLFTRVESFSKYLRWSSILSVMPNSLRILSLGIFHQNQPLK